MRYLLLLIILTSSFAAHSQFTLTGEIRPRAEFRDGFKTLSSADSDPAFFVEQRSRLYFNYVNERVEFQLTFQDVRLWGDTRQIYKQDNALTNVFEAYAIYKFTEKAAIKFGRQALDYDNARFLGNLAWAQQARSHDAFLFTYSGAVTLHAGVAYNQEDQLSNSEPSRLFGNFYAQNGNYKTMQFLWLNKKSASGSSSLLAFNNGVQAADSTVRYSQTLGTYHDYKLGGIKLTAEAYYQLGKTVTDADLNAYMASLAVGIPVGNMTWTVGGDYLSGDQGEEGSFTAFTPFYGTNHKFYGLMDYFYVGNGHSNVGLIDGFIRANVPINASNKLMIAAHAFSSEVALTGSSDQYLGTEVDLVYNKKFGQAMDVKIGYSQMLASDNMEIVKAGSASTLNQWGWMMLTIKPQLLKVD